MKAHNYQLVHIGTHHANNLSMETLWSYPYMGDTYDEHTKTFYDSPRMTYSNLFAAHPDLQLTYWSHPAPSYPCNEWLSDHLYAHLNIGRVPFWGGPVLIVVHRGEVMVNITKEMAIEVLATFLQ